MKKPSTNSSFCGNLHRPLACPAVQNEIPKEDILHDVKEIQGFLLDEEESRW